MLKKFSIHWFFDIYDKFSLLYVNVAGYIKGRKTVGKHTTKLIIVEKSSIL